MDAEVPHGRVQRHGVRAYFSVFAAAFDAFVAVFVEVGEVFPEFFVGGVDDVSVFDGGEFLGQGADGGDVELVLMGLEIPELGELLAAVVESTEVRLGLIVYDLVGSYVAALREAFSADFALVWSFTSVSSLVSLEIAEL